MGRFFQELRRRKVFHVATVYSLTAWLLAQGLALVVSTYGAPDWVQPTLVAVLLAGFPVAIVLAWAFEVTPEGVRRVAAVASGEHPVSAANGILFVLVGVLTIAVAWLLWRLEFAPTGDPGPATEQFAEETTELTVAVLPFGNLSPDPENAYFATGLHEEILNQLVRAGRVSVVARTSVQQYLGTTKTVPEIADELGVANVLEGSVRYAGNEVRITAQLIDGASGLHIWSDTWDRRLENIFALQSEVAEAVADSMNAELNPVAATLSPASTTDNQEAYDLYLQALAIRSDPNSLNFATILDLTTRAIELDPDFAPAYTVRANAYINRLEGGITADEGIELARSDLETALSLDRDLVEAWHQMAAVHLAQYEWQAAVAANRRAAELDPLNGRILATGARLQLVLGERELALRLAERAVELDPLEQWNLRQLALAYRATGQDTKAAAVARRLVDTGVYPAAGLYYLMLLEANAGNFDEARQLFEAMSEVARSSARDARVIDTRLITTYAVLSAKEGDTDRAREILVEQTEILDQGDTDHAYLSVGVMRIAVALGEFNEAFRTLDRLAGEPSGILMSLIAVDAEFAPLRADPRWQDVLGRTGLGS